MALVMLALSVTVLEIFTNQKWVNLTLTDRMGQDQICKSANRKPTRDIQFVDNSNACPICHRLRDIDSRP